MSQLYNKKILKQYRRNLRRNSTDTERYLWSKIRNKKLGVKFFRQYSVDNYILDFYCTHKRLCIELDGGHHFYSEQKKYDEIRTEYLNELNIRVIRFSNVDVMRNIEEVLGKIVEEIS